MLPFDTRTVVALAIVVALPYLSLTLTMIPFEELVRHVIGKPIGW
jgi:hypothetical protein